MGRDPRLDVVDPCKHWCGCDRRVPRKWFQCNACSKGWCFAPCEQFIEADLGRRLIPECARCGWLMEEHL